MWLELIGATPNIALGGFAKVVIKFDSRMISSETNNT